MMIKLIIDYGAEREVRRVERLVPRIPWFKENGYAITLPEGIAEDSTETDINTAIKNEYSEASYLAYAHSVQEPWEKFLPRLTEIRSTLPFALRDAYTLVLTRYGTGGSYDAISGTIVINIVTRSQERALGTLIHEAIHIAVQPLIEKYKVSHWRKERLVDLIGERYFANLRKMQNLKEDVSVVDVAFANFYPDIEKICSVV